MSRQRQVFPRDTVAHLWANASQDSARDPSGNFYYNGPILYSYGSHHVIAYRMENADGSASYLWNADTYGVTTSRHHAVASRAVPGYRNRYAITGLRSNSFYGQAWRAKLIREALSQAGAAYERAAKLARKSGKRDAEISTAYERIRAAEYLAHNTLKTKDAHADNRKAARVALRCIAKVAAWDADADNATQRANATRNAAMLVRDEMRDEMRRKIAAGLREVETARDASPWIGRGDERARYRQQCARYAVQLFANARDIAKRYKFKMPRVPDAAAIVAELEPAARQETLQECARDARRALQDSESMLRLYSLNRSSDWHLSSARHYALQVSEAARVADSRISPETVPQWMRERARAIAAKCARHSQIARAAHSAERIAAKVEVGDSYANAGNARDAAREYRNAINAAQGIRENLPETHPARKHLPDADTLQRIAAYLVKSDARIAAENAERIAAWRDNRDTSPRFNTYDVPALLRVSRDAQRIETSRAAFVPASVCPMIWQAANACRDAGQAHDYGDTGDAPRIGSFTLNTIHADGSITAGCHEIAFSELEYIAGKLGYMPANMGAGNAVIQPCSANGYAHGLL